MFPVAAAVPSLEQVAAKASAFLSAHLYDSAAFLAARLYAEEPSSMHAQLLAQAEMLGGRPTAALSALAAHSDAAARYLRAQAALALGRLQTAEEALLGPQRLHLGVQGLREGADAGVVDVPGEAAGLCLLGKICRRGGRFDEARDCFAMACAREPLLWEASEALAELGGGLDDTDALGNDDSEAILGPAPAKGDVVGVVKVLQRAHQHNCRNQSDRALAVLAPLPPRHAHTGLVQYQRGRAYFEKGDFASAVEALKAMQRVAPHRIAGLELLSTAHWHLKQEVELCYLAQTAKQMDRMRPEVWCVVGNCFSLQKEHETAIRFFKRALQVDPTFTYAYSLCGHEYVANEDFDRALACYRHAIRCDERHYNGWYGIGAIYFRQEKLPLAEIHFRRALSLHPRSSVLQCYLGMVLQARGQPEEALAMLDAAISLGRSNPQARFQRANVLLQMGRLEDAVVELGVVCDAAPKEPSVHTLLGKVLKKLGAAEEARRHFTTALDLDPKDTNFLKNAMEHDEDDAY